MDKKISSAVIKRLPRYYRFLGDLLDNGIMRISSKDLSAKMNVTASQIRQDLNNFGCFGQQGYGYNVESLFNEIKSILGINKSHNLVIIGAGNIGQALMNYPNFKRRGFKFIGIFDINKALINKTIKDIKVRHIDELPHFLKGNQVDIAVLSVPRNNAESICKLIVDAGIRGIWNFSNIELKVPEDVIIENVHLTDSLMQLTYKFNTNYEFLE